MNENWQNTVTNYDLIEDNKINIGNDISPEEKMLRKKFVVLENSLPEFTSELNVKIETEKELNTVIYYITSDENANEDFQAVVSEFKKIYDHYIIGIDNMSLEKLVVNELHKQKILISAAESCTGGLFISRLISIPGASNVIDRSYVVYSDRAKRDVLDVDKGLIKRYGAVSPDVAEAMVKGVKKLSGADIGVSITGYAGGGETELPEDGLFYFAIAYKDYLHIEKGNFKGTRNETRFAQATHILWRLLTILKSEIAQR